ncbi:hypothetical protein PGT21_024455 [Puccinia graminis f. sp. tritici]|uniref:Uncharacterized protein n=1 Tax=Puccinia graminis f. sp. tritici TaxID=56615 RepID=A0A5B0LWM0_PUCGR|nr:hypothetical protein PGT21_024455 [Puccinia graminis f. sp. tritici]
MGTLAGVACLQANVPRVSVHEESRHLESNPKTARQGQKLMDHQASDPDETIPNKHMCKASALIKLHEPGTNNAFTFESS